LGGKRICIGKTFAENIAKCVLPIILSRVDFEFVNKENYEKKPTPVFLADEDPILVKVTKVDL